VSLTIFPRPELRGATRPASRDGLYALASAWRATTETNIRPFARPAARPAAAAGDGDATAPETPYVPDGPSAA
jgi:hypothetical protein